MGLQALTMYVGLGLGVGSTTADSPKVGVFGTRDTSSSVVAVFAGLRVSYIGVEAGYLSLPKYQAHAIIPDYPAYRMANFRQVVDSPAGADATQKITSHADYVRLKIYGPEFWKITPYAFLGHARVTTANTEDATYSGPDDTAHFHITFKQSARYLGAGLGTDMSRRWSVRAEAGYIPSAVQSHWTLRRDVLMGTLSALWTW